MTMVRGCANCHFSYHHTKHTKNVFFSSQYSALPLSSQVSKRGGIGKVAGCPGLGAPGKIELSALSPEKSQEN